MLIILFLLLFVPAIVIDLQEHRRSQDISLKDAAWWSGLYVMLSLAFGVVLALVRGPHDAALYLSGWMLEKVLSVDNLLVFSAVFAYFGIGTGGFQRKILTCGIAGAVVLRLVFVLVGATMLHFLGRPMEIVLAAVVAWSAIKLLRSQGDDGEDGAIDHSRRWYILWTKKVFRSTPDASKPLFFDVVGRATPLLFCLVAIEMTDIMFSFDSVPVVISVTRDPFLIYTAMLSAIVGLRSMYFVLEALKRYFTYLGPAVIWVLMFVSFKLFVHAIAGIEFPIGWSFALITVILGTGILRSLRPIKGHGNTTTSGLS